MKKPVAAFRSFENAPKLVS